MNLTSPWPDNYRCAACISFDLDAEWVFMGNIPETIDMPRRLSLGEYVWNAKIIERLLDLLDRYKIKSTFFVVGRNAQNHPDVMQEIIRRGHEIGTHGWQHENIVGVGRNEEERRLLKTIEAIENSTGVLPVGNRTAGGELSKDTLDILLENNFEYDSSLRGNDLPYVAYQKKEGKLFEVPSYYEVDDFHLFADYPGTKYHARQLGPQSGYDAWTLFFEGCYKYALCFTTMFHPQIIGKPSYIILFERLLKYIQSYPNVWFAPAKEIAEYWSSIEDLTA